MKNTLYCLVVLTSLATASACNNEPPPPPKPVAPAPPVAATIDPTKMLFFPALAKEAPAPPENPTTPAKVDLGHRLFFEARLSGSGKVSCESCHQLASYGIDGLSVEKVEGKTTLPPRNTPTVYNVAMNGTFGWDGRGTSLESFVETHLGEDTGPGASVSTLPKTLGKVRGLEAEFAKVFGKGKDAISPAHVAQALSAYLRQLQTPAAWDRFATGDKTALTEEQKRGFNTFVDARCTTCHSGVNVGGALVQKLGLVKPWPPTADLGRYATTKAESDKMMFRSAPLRNAARTAPYLHDGSIKSIEEMATLMADHQLGKTLTQEEAAGIVAFLGAFVGELPPPALIADPTKR